MPGFSNVETAKRMCEISDRNALIFSYRPTLYMQNSYDVQAYQYLKKSFAYELFESKLNKLISYL